MNEFIDKIENHLRESCPECGEDVFPLSYILNNYNNTIPDDAFIIECGVASGSTINMIGNSMKKTKNIYGFDSFEGLPEEWNDGELLYKKGWFSTNGNMPIVPRNVNLIKGWFNQTLPIFKQDVLKESPISLLHVDCDLYSSSKEIFTCFEKNIVSGTIIVFDELWNYPDYKQHEIKAFAEYLQKNNKWFEPLICRQKEHKLYLYKEVAIRIIDIN